MIEEKKLYFFRYAGYGGECYIVKAKTKRDAKTKLEKKLGQDGYWNDEINAYVSDCNILDFENDIAKTLGEE